MEDVFFTVHSEVKKLVLGSSYSQDVHKALSAFERILLKGSPSQIQCFVDTFYETIRETVFHIRELIRIYPQLRSDHDRIFTKILRLEKTIPLGLTLLFQEFIKGITYFASQESSISPIYHRLESCGRGDDAFRKSFQQCHLNMTKDDRQTVKKKIETCYIERLIYNEMYMYQTLHFPQVGHEQHSQDKEHVYRLFEVTRRDFKSCFPNLDIAVKLEFEQHMPVQLTITRLLKTHKKRKRTSHEVYKKTVRHGIVPCYIPIVECWRRTDINTYVKTQGYVANKPWDKLNAIQ